ncbi:MAG: UDP-N-acetylmuramoyl-L-alanine--D-glutamate ligase [Parachlamydiales bacterium]
MKGSHYVVLGMGISGRSAAKALLHLGAAVTAYDRRAEALKIDPAIASLIHRGLELYQDEDPYFPAHCSGVILSPGIPLEHSICKKALELKIEVVGEIEFACRHLKGKFIGVTGTNGKTTVTSHIVHTLNFYGISAKAMGNIGIPLSELLCEDDNVDVVALELSSYQLETMSTPVLDTAIFLNLTPDHLDRYNDMDEYGSSKARIGLCLKPGRPLYISSELKQNYAQLFAKMPYDLSVYDSYLTHFDSSLPLHDQQNIAAVCAICSYWNIGYKKVLDAFKTFSKGEHRIEFVASVNGIDFYDDSKGTNVDAVIKAVSAIPKKIILIAGGVPKGAKFTCWKKPFSGKVKAVCAIGEAAGQLHHELGDDYTVNSYQTLEEAVNSAFMLAGQGDVILLSPGCASFDMFRDYAHRGQVFQECVQRLSCKHPS